MSSRVIHLASAPLPAAGAYTNQAALPVPIGVTKVVFYLSYTLDPTGTGIGYPVYKLIWSDGVDEFIATTLNTNITLVGNTAVQSLYPAVYRGPIPSSAAVLRYMIEVTIPGGTVNVKLLAAEEGEIAKPGTAAITATTVH